VNNRVRILIIAGALVIGILASWPFMVRIGTGNRLRFYYNGTLLSENAYDELARAPGWSKSTITVENEVRLRGLVRRPTNSLSPWILFYSGNDATQLLTAQKFLTALSQDRDWGLAAFAYRGFDGSDGEENYTDLASDAPVIFTEFCKQEQLSENKVHLAGFSIGGHFAAITSRASRAQGKPAKSLSLLASVSDIAMLPKSRLSDFRIGEVYLTLPILDGISAPVLVLQGMADEGLNGTSQGRAIAGRLGNRAKYQEFVGVGHQDLLFHEPALSTMRSFIVDHSR
jgi:pimeloyl-ACP methyl ester carboxylesterase